MSQIIENKGQRHFLIAKKSDALASAFMVAQFASGQREKSGFLIPNASGFGMTIVRAASGENRRSARKANACHAEGWRYRGGIMRRLDDTLPPVIPLQPLHPAFSPEDS
jgi:hypothetical protein